MKNVLTFAAVAEAATGLGLLIVPSPVGQLLLGVELAPASQYRSRAWPVLP